MAGPFSVDTIWKDGEWSWEVQKHVPRKGRALGVLMPSSLDEMVNAYRDREGFADVESFKETCIRRYGRAVLGHRYLMGDITLSEYNALRERL